MFGPYHIGVVVTPPILADPCRQLRRNQDQRESANPGFEFPPGRDTLSTVLFLKSILFTILLPGTVTVVVPHLILPGSHSAIRWNSLAILAALPLVLGAVILFWCIWDFAISGRGTLAPVDPPKDLVVSGLYRYVRNPMYIGVLMVLLGETWLFHSWALLVYAVGYFAFAQAFVLFYEEPTLRRKFGGSYARYCETVNRWLPRKPRESSL